MTPTGDIIGLIIAVISLIMALSAAWYTIDQREREKEALEKIQNEFYNRTRHPETHFSPLSLVHHSPEVSQDWLSASPSMSLSASPTTTTTFSASISYSPEQDEEWTGSSGTTFVKTPEEIFTGISGTIHLPVMKVPAKDERCQWCGHRYPLVLNGIEVYYCPKCGGPRK